MRTSTVAGAFRGCLDVNKIVHGDTKEHEDTYSKDETDLKDKTLVKDEIIEAAIESDIEDKTVEIESVLKHQLSNIEHFV